MNLNAYYCQSIIYDEQGNPTSYLGHTLTWEKGRQLKSFDNNTYTYNANGIRTSKTVNDVEHIYTLDGNKILKECWNYNETTKTYNDILIPLYDDEDSVCGIIYNNTPYYFQKNLQGDIISIATVVDGEDGYKEVSVVARYTYDAWGKIVSIRNGNNNADVSSDDTHIANINPFRYRGYYYDTEIGMCYLQSRYYNPTVGRFVNGDETEFLAMSDEPIVNNMFSYCENNVVNQKDETGNVSLKTVTSFLKSLLKWIKKIVGWVKKAVVRLLNVYTSLSWQEVSSIAKDIGRSPRRVKQAIESLVKKLTKAKHYIERFAIGIAILCVIASLGEKIVRLGNIAKTIAECTVEAMISFLQWAFSAGLKALLSLIPAVGSILALFAKSIVSLVFKVLLTFAKIKKIKQKVTSTIELATYGLADYFVVFFKNLA